MYRSSNAKAIPPKGEGFSPVRWNNKPTNRIAAGVIITIWILLALAAMLFIVKMVQF